MNNRSRKVLLGAATLAAIMGGAQGAHAATANVNMSAKIIAAIAISASNALNFGTLSLTGVGPYEVTVPATGAASVGTGAVSLVAGQAPGSFKITAVPGVEFTVAAPATDTVSNGATQLTVKSFVFGTANATKLDATLTGTNTTGVYNIGATLHIPVGSQPGTYNGQVTVTAAYN